MKGVSSNHSIDQIANYINQSVKISGVPLEKYSTSHKVRKIATEGETSESMLKSTIKKKVFIGPYKHNNRSLNNLSKKMIVFDRSNNDNSPEMSRPKRDLSEDSTSQSKHERVYSKVGPGFNSKEECLSPDKTTHFGDSQRLTQISRF